MNCLITGGAGFIGSHVVDKLISSGNHVIVLDNLSAGKIENLSDHIGKENFRFFEQDINNDLSDIFETESIDCVFHLAAIPQVQYSIENPAIAHNVDVNGTVAILEMCRKYGVNRFVFSSSSAIYGNQDRASLTEDLSAKPLSPYALHKLIGEHYCRLYHSLYGIEAISLRYFNVFGPRQNPSSEYASLIPKFAKKINGGEIPTINGDGNQTRDFVYVSDVAEANIMAAKTENTDCFGNVFNIGSGIKTTVNDIFLLLCTLLDKNVKPLYGPALVEVRDSLADIQKAQNVLGWKPTVSLDTALKNYLDLL